MFAPPAALGKTCLKKSNVNKAYSTLSAKTGRVLPCIEESNFGGISVKKIVDGVYYTGVLNPGMRVFDVIMRTEYGTSYNSYIVRGREKTALIEAAHLSFFEYFADNLQEILGDNAPDYLVLNHCEPDHTGCIAKLLERYPNLTIVVSQAGSIYIKQIVNRPDMKIQVAKDGDTIDLGGKTLEFRSAPFLHWPDSMFTWLAEDQILFSCDFLGCHFCEPQIFDTRIAYEDKYWDAVKYYYDCIFGPFNPYVRKGLEKIRGLDIAYCCNSHGPILTKEGKLADVIACYDQWSQPEESAKKVIPIFYVTAYGNTRLIAEAAAEGIRDMLPDAEVGLYNIIEHDLTHLTGLMNESDAFLVGSPTINRDAVAPVWQLLAGMEAVNIQKRPVAVFGSYGWSGEAIPHLIERLSSVKANVFTEYLKVNFVPTTEDLEAAKAFGKAFAQSI